MSDYDKIKNCIIKANVELRKFVKNQREFRRKHNNTMSDYELHYFIHKIRSEESASKKLNK